MPGLGRPSLPAVTPVGSAGGWVGPAYIPRGGDGDAGSWAVCRLLLARRLCLRSRGTVPAGGEVGLAVGPGRLHALIDGVFAIALTLLVLDLPRPAHSTQLVHDLLHA